MSISILFSLMLLGFLGSSGADIGVKLPIIVPGGEKVPIIIPNGEQSTAKPTARQTTTKSSSGSGCPIGCPKGWVRFGYSENCYKLPAQPAHLDTFWEHQRRCKQMEPKSYVAVMNSLAEQGVATPVAMQYAANWFAVLTNGFIWLGGYTDQNGWKFLDGSDQKKNPLMLIANIIGSQRNDTCLGADPKTLGAWQTRPCSDKTGAAICEMPRRPVCGGNLGEMLPISPINFSPSSIAELFPKLPSIPFLGQILGDSALDKGLTQIESTISCWLGGECKSGTGSSGTQRSLPSGCRLDCPPGWVSSTKGPTSQCYLIPSADKADADTFWNMQDKCKSVDSTAYVAMINTLMELSILTAVTQKHGPKWKQDHSDGFLWLGAYTDNTEWHLLDGSEQSGSLLMAMANLPARTPGSFRNNTCLGADLITAGNWFAAPCDRKTGLAICEMPKKPICGNAQSGEIIDSSPKEFTVPELQAYFPNAPDVPFLAEVLEGRSQSSFDPQQAAKNNKTGEKLGDAVANIYCVRKGRLTNNPEWFWLYVDREPVIVSGQWTEVKCKSGTVTAFKVAPLSYLSAWTRCYNKGWEVPMPANSFLNGWYPFLVGDTLPEYYREDSGWLGKLTAKVAKTGTSKVKDC